MKCNTEYINKLANLSEEEKDLRNIYLREIAKGKKYGPLVGYSSIDRPWLKYFDEDAIRKKIPDMNAFDYFLLLAPDDVPLMEYCDKLLYKNDIKQEVEKYIGRFSAMGVGVGETVSFVMLNVPESFFMWQALTKMGAIANLIRPDEGPERIAYMNNTASSKYMFISDDQTIVENVIQSIKEGNQAEQIIVVSPFVSCTFAGKKSKTTLADNRFVSYDDWNNQYTITEHNVINGGGNNTAIIVYTGGTTGSPKGVELTNKNIIAGANSFKYGNYGFDKGMVSLNILPTGIAYGINATYNVMCCGVRVIDLASFSVEDYPELIEKYKPNVVFSGPILLGLIVEKNISADLSFVKVPLSGGDKLHINEEISINKYLKNKNSDACVYQGYGMSECSAGATVAKKDAYKTGSVGIPLLNVDVAIFDYQDKTIEKPYGEIGEICVSGPIIMKKYRKSSDDAENVLIKHDDGKVWLHTDDLGFMDNEGHLYHQGRAKRMLTRSGNKVWLSALEDTIKRHDNVKECCCVKQNDAIEREVPVAHIVLFDDSLSIQTCKELDLMVKNNQPITYIPKCYVVRSHIPITSGNNKIDFRSLEEESVIINNRGIIAERIYKGP